MPTADGKGVIDGCIVEPETPQVQPDGSALTVLLCNPNAGMYESMNGPASGGDWLCFYSSIGLRVVLFNYRGWVPRLVKTTQLTPCLGKINAVQQIFLLKDF